MSIVPSCGEAFDSVSLQGSPQQPPGACFRSTISLLANKHSKLVFAQLTIGKFKSCIEFLQARVIFAEVHALFLITGVRLNRPAISKWLYDALTVRKDVFSAVSVYSELFLSVIVCCM